MRFKAETTFFFILDTSVPQIYYTVTKLLNLADTAPLVVKVAAVLGLQTARSAVKGGEGQIGFA